MFKVFSETPGGKMLEVVKRGILPLLLALYVPVLHYANNAVMLLLPSLFRMVMLSIVAAVVIYILFFMIGRRVVESANAAFVFLIFFHTYGLTLDFLITANVPFLATNRYLFPVFLLIALLVSWFTWKMGEPRSSRFWNSAVFIVGMLILINAVSIVSAEIKKMPDWGAAPTPVLASTSKTQMQDYPDIYFIVFDEFSGFQPMREYWKNPKVDEFVAFLKSTGFFVAEDSHSSSITTLHQMAERLNYEELPCCQKKYHELYYEKIANNRVTSYLKSRGYSIVVIEELTEFIEAAVPISADVSINHSTRDSVGDMVLFDEFGRLVAENSMLRVYPPLYTLGDDLARIEHKRFISTIANRIAGLNEVSSPKFVYVHLVFPHKPFMFDENGKVIPKRYQANWNYYLDQYNYSMDVAVKIVETILANSDPERPPVIILQSDHGARNIKNKSTTITLENFPEEFKSNIMFALYAPGYDISTLPQDVKPINTFPIVFNFLFQDNIPLK
ncbi:MAG: hypothetical protein DPW18_10995 [Chloroflexi bacterium]|nr:hypothetical protein [Chloroflexota bacterium]MDL1944205.1 hypothetical protein [Chloroflexi bacterium CFX2]